MFIIVSNIFSFARCIALPMLFIIKHYSLIKKCFEKKNQNIRCYRNIRRYCHDCHYGQNNHYGNYSNALMFSKYISWFKRFCQGFVRTLYVFVLILKYQHCSSLSATIFITQSISGN